MKKNVIINISSLLSKIIICLGMAMIATACNKDTEDFMPEDGNNNYSPTDETEEYMSLLASKKGSLLSSYTWQDYNTLGLFLTKGTLDQPYQDNKLAYSNIKATMNAGLWNLYPDPVVLTDDKAIIFAYSPYISNANPYAIPVETGTRTLYMYGTHLAPQVSVCKGDNIASLEMANAMAIIDIYVRKTENLQGQVFLEEIAIEGRNDSIRLPIKGTLDIMTGQLASTDYGKYGFDKLKQILNTSYSDTCLYRLTAFPRDNKENEVYLSIKVNGNRMSLPMNEEHDWKAGIRNIYNITFNGYDLDVENVQIKPWKDVEVKEGELNEKEGKQDEE